MMLAGRFLAGLSAAGYSPNIQIFVAEISEARNRGWLSGLTMPMMSIGVLLVYTMGSWLPWHFAAAICTLVPLCLLAALSPYFDSPYWYFSIGKEKNAHMAIEQFRGPATNVVSEVFTIQQHVESSQSEEDISFFTAVIKVFTEKKYFKPFFILNFLFFLMIFSGDGDLSGHNRGLDVFLTTERRLVPDHLLGDLHVGRSSRALLHPLPLHRRVLPFRAEVRAGRADHHRDQHPHGSGHQNIHQPGLSAGPLWTGLALLGCLLRGHPAYTVLRAGDQGQVPDSHH